MNTTLTNLKYEGTNDDGHSIITGWVEDYHLADNLTCDFQIEIVDSIADDLLQGFVKTPIGFTITGCDWNDVGEMLIKNTIEELNATGVTWTESMINDINTYSEKCWEESLEVY